MVSDSDLGNDVTPKGLRQRYQRRLAALKTERSSWDANWKELAEYIQPRRSRFFTTETNRGTKKHQSVINGTPIWAARVLAAGMMAGLTSPTRPWFRLTTPDPELAEHGPVRAWLHVVEERCRQAFARSNVYKGLAQVYLDIGTPGTAAMLLEEDPEELLRAYVFPIGSFCLANDARGRVNSLFRETRMTVFQLVDEFGMKGSRRVSDKVIDLYKRGNYDTWNDVVHVIEPNVNWREGAQGPEGFKFKSCWYESSTQPAVGSGADSTDLLLRESGYHEFPAMCPRWSLTGEDVYGSSPGMEAIGDAKALQLLEKRKTGIVDKLVNPPMRGPSSLYGKPISLLPGDTTFVDSNNPSQMFAPAHEVQPQALVAAESSAREYEERIKRAYFADLWLALSDRAEGGDITAREVAERHEEKMLQLGPVLEQLEDELLEPLIDRCFAILDRNGYLPPPPPELEGVELRVDYISILAQAQKALANAGIEKLSAFVGAIAPLRPDVIDKLNTDEMVDEYATGLSVKPDLVRTDDEVALIRQQRAQQQQQAQQLQQAAAAVEGAKTLSQADMSGDNALTRVMGNVPGIGRA